MTGLFSMQMHSVGINFNQVRATLFKDFDFHSVRTATQPAFVKKYRVMLKSFVKDRLGNKLDIVA
jgi:hypothetical protein